MYEIIPGVLEKDWRAIEKKLEIIKSFKTTESDLIPVHVDIIDGKFASNTTFLDPLPFKKYSRDLFLELHMMVEDPFQYLESFAEAGFKRFIAQVECLPEFEKQAEFVAMTQALGKTGLAIDSPTSLEAIKIPYEKLDCVLIMMVKAGESGQKFNPQYLEKIRKLRKISPDINIEVDGGMNEETVVLAKNAGANVFAVNSYIFNASNPRGQYMLLQNKLKERG